ncbi:hypothetical protein HID58_076056 [Brassica napus]|uniref:Uncharacterized protein n=1 Tax=Brassica napus TaxID=3708 RepID=A0ABQ7YLD9_BRANA|nr:hypothetical protein HID58_076056 [Brassica napus]
MDKIGFNHLDNGQPNKLKCLGLALLRFFCLVFFDSSSSSSIPLPCVRFFFLVFVLLRFSFDSPLTSEAIYAKNNPNPSDDQKQAFVVVGRAITGIEAELKVEKLQSLISSLISVCSRTKHEMEVREMLLQLLVDLSRSCYLCTVVTGVVVLVLMSVEIEMCCCYVADEMDADILNLNDDDYLSVEDIMAENEDDQNAQADQKAQDDSVQSIFATLLVSVM